MCLALPGKVQKIYSHSNPLLIMADVNFEGVIKKINIAFVENVKLGDYVIVHAGVALQLLDETSALETINSFNELGIK